MVGKTAIVTGGSRGIGAAISKALSKCQIAVALTYKLQQSMAKKVVKEIHTLGGKAIALQMAVEDRSSIKKALAIIKEQFGFINVLVNNAAIAQEKAFNEITDENWDDVLSVNLRGPFTLCQELLPDMQKQGWGRIINISSIGGQWGGFNQVHYAASKAGLISLTRSLARIYSQDGITINSIAPGLVGSDMARRELESESGKAKVKSIPIGRISTPEEVANVAVFLSGDASSYITGQTINVNGGMYFS